MRESVFTHGGLIISYIIIIIITNTITTITNVYIGLYVGLSRVRKFSNIAFIVNKDDVIGPNNKYIKMKNIVYKEVFPQ